MKTKTIVLFVVSLGIAGPASAAVSLSITRPPVFGVANVGPLNDPDATQGQWFENNGSRPHEFFDNVAGDGGGTSNSNAIMGYVSSITYSGANIVGFSVSTTITNDTGTETGTWACGVNSHAEGIQCPLPYQGTLGATMLTAEFALASLSLVPPAWTGPYFTVSTPAIVATNEDDTAWYCFNSLADPPQNVGNYYVPAWSFGDIPQNASATRTLDFIIGDGTIGMDNTDPRFAVIVDSFGADHGLGQGDIFANRTTSLKISDWVDPLFADDGSPYIGVLSQSHSNVSVFAIPEPSASGLLGLLLSFVALSRRRR
jgi:hypothetical protein